MRTIRSSLNKPTTITLRERQAVVVLTPKGKLDCVYALRGDRVYLFSPENPLP